MYVLPGKASDSSRYLAMVVAASDPKEGTSTTCSKAGRGARRTKKGASAPKVSKPKSWRAEGGGFFPQIFLQPDGSINLGFLKHCPFPLVRQLH